MWLKYITFMPRSLVSNLRKSEIDEATRREKFLRPSRTAGTARGEKISRNKVDSQFMTF